MEIRAYIQDLFKYIESFEKGAAGFETEAFLQTYNGIYAVFQALREQRDKAVKVDEYFYDWIRQSPLTSSDLRQLAVQVMITYFESEADTDGQTNKSYLYCRGLRGVRQDVPFFENYLLPLLFKEGSLGGNFRLNQFFLDEMARYINKFGKKVNLGMTPEEFSALPDPMKFLELARRRVELGNDILKDRGSLEFNLQRMNIFNKLGQKSRLMDQYLTEWHYLTKTNFWQTIKDFFSVLGGKFKGVFSNSRYFRLVLTQRNLAYFYYTFLILLFLFLAIFVPVSWNKYSQRQLQGLQDKVTQVQSGSLK